MSYYPDLASFLKLSRKGNLIPVCRELSVNPKTPTSAFLKIKRGKYSYLLESVEGSEKVARYSFLATEPRLILKCRGRKISLTEKKKTRRFTAAGDVLDEIKKILSRYRFVKVKGMPRFVGGMVGYLGYEVVNSFERLPLGRVDDLKFPDAIFVLSDTVLAFDHIRQRLKIVSCAYLKDDSSRREIEAVYRRATKRIMKIVEKLEKDLAAPRRRKTPSIDKARVSSNFSKKEFARAVGKIKEYIRRGDTIQTVLSQRFSRKLATPPFEVYRALRSLNPSPYLYYLEMGEVTLIGSSPELFVRCEGARVETRPIAGTRRRGKNEKEDKKLARELASDPKERAEHLMLVDLGRNDMGRVSRYGTVEVSEFMEIEKYSHVMHLVSSVTGTFKKAKDCFDLIRAAFPAGTVSGAPKIRAMEIIDELEPTCRGPYAGFVGYFDFSGNLDSCITIRTIAIKGKRAYVQAGAGIVADSRPMREFKETVSKARALLKAMEIAEDFKK